MSDTYTEFGALKYNPQDIAQRGFGMAASGPDDNTKIVLFYTKSIHNQAKSREQSKSVFESRDFIKIQFPGETLMITDRPVIESDKHRWPQKWMQYQAGKDQVPDGIPVGQLFPTHPHIPDMLSGFNVHTVEQLAALSGNAIQNIGMGCQDWVNRAQSYMKQAEKGVTHHKHNADVERLTSENMTLRRQVGELSEQVNKLIQAMQSTKAVDPQLAQINASMRMQAQTFDPPPANFSNDIATATSTPVRQRKPRSDKGVARGPRKEP
jgi:hypothetical protein